MVMGDDLERIISQKPNATSEEIRQMLRVGEICGGCLIGESFIDENFYDLFEEITQKLN